METKSNIYRPVLIVVFYDIILFSVLNCHMTIRYNKAQQETDIHNTTQQNKTKHKCSQHITPQHDTDVHKATQHNTILVKLHVMHFWPSVLILQFIEIGGQKWKGGGKPTGGLYNVPNSFVWCGK